MTEIVDIGQSSRDIPLEIGEARLVILPSGEESLTLRLNETDRLAVEWEKGELGVIKLYSGDSAYKVGTVEDMIAIEELVETLSETIRRAP